MRQIEKRIRLRIPTGKPLTQLKRKSSGRSTVGVRATIRAISEYEFADDTRNRNPGTVGIFESLRAISAWVG